MKSTEDNRRITQGTEHSVNKFEGKIGGEFVKQLKPQFLEEREKIWAEFYQKQQEHQKSLPRDKIIITLKDGKKVEGTSFDTTPLDIAKKYLKKSLVGDLIVAKVFFHIHILVKIQQKSSGY
jgi:threonyl-tRNA synthetase